mmetsp:Transcript_4285/g.16002  ORF Transcript_4285/g.16002 Transcript_4285/m.16002 type:complete len:368 (+) Transcript_4285:845-1948(+)
MNNPRARATSPECDAAAAAAVRHGRLASLPLSKADTAASNSPSSWSSSPSECAACSLAGKSRARASSSCRAPAVSPSDLSDRALACRSRSFPGHLARPSFATASWRSAPSEELGFSLPNPDPPSPPLRLPPRDAIASAFHHCVHAWAFSGHVSTASRNSVLARGMLYPSPLRPLVGLPLATSKDAHEQSSELRARSFARDPPPPPSLDRRLVRVFAPPAELLSTPDTSSPSSSGSFARRAPPRSRAFAAFASLARLTRVPLAAPVIPRAASRVASSPFRNNRSALPTLPSRRSVSAHACQLGACDSSKATASWNSLLASAKFLSSTSSSAHACEVAARVGSATRHSRNSRLALATRPLDRSNTAHAW